jgi:hypothetical protein
MLGFSKEYNLEQRNQYQLAQEHSTVCVFRKKKKKPVSQVVVLKATS